MAFGDPYAFKHPRLDPRLFPDLEIKDPIPVVDLNGNVIKNPITVLREIEEDEEIEDDLDLIFEHRPIEDNSDYLDWLFNEGSYAED